MKMMIFFLFGEINSLFPARLLRELNYLLVHREDDDFFIIEKNKTLHFRLVFLGALNYLFAGCRCSFVCYLLCNLWFKSCL